MAIRTTLISLAAILTLAATAATVQAAMIPIYDNPLTSNAARAQLSKESGDKCKRGGNKRAMRIVIGESTQACEMRAPVVGRDLELSVVGRLLSGTPAKLRPRTYLSTSLRVGDGGLIQARVFPASKKLQLLKTTPEGETRYLSIVKQAGAIRPVNKANRILLRTINTATPAHCRIVVRVNGRRLAAVGESRCAQLTGRDAPFGVGATRGGEGATASFAKLRISVPNPF